MGIQGLTKVLGDQAPHSITEVELKNLFGRKIAVDASMSLYQFLIAVRPDAINTLTDEAGETTSHLQGLFQRTIRMVVNGIKPAYVFDGKPPVLKTEELDKRREKREEAEEGKKEAIEVGDKESVSKFSKRTVKVTRQHNEEAKKLLRLMGIPVLEAPCEAEAQCAAMTKAGLVSDLFPTGTLFSSVLGVCNCLRRHGFSYAWNSYFDSSFNLFRSQKDAY